MCVCVCVCVCVCGILCPVLYSWGIRLSVTMSFAFILICTIPNYGYVVCFGSDVIFPLTAPPPSKSFLRNICKNTTDLDKLSDYLSIPDDKRDVDSAVEYYARSTDPVKMRRMIYYLDHIGDTALAESVMDYAEPPAGITAPVQ